MNGSIEKIQGFPCDDNIWRVDMLCRFSRSGAIPSDPLVEIALSCIPPGQPARNRKPLVVQVSAGYLLYIRIGSAWRNGQRTPQGRIGYETTEYFNTIHVSDKTTRIVPADLFREENSIKQYLISPMDYYLGPAGLKSKFLGIDYDGVENRILIPTIEVGRFYYFNSTQLIRPLLWGKLAPDNNEIFDPSVSRLNEDGSGIIRLRSGIPYSDAWVVSRFAHSAIGFSGALGIHDSLVLESMSNISGPNLFLAPDILPPFDGETNLKLHGKWITSWGEKRFLVYWIESCSHPFPANELWYTSEQDNQSDGVIDPDRPEAFGGMLRRPPPRTKITEAMVFRSDTEPRKDTLPTTVLLKSNRFTDLAHKPIRRLPKESCEYRSGPRILLPDLPGINGFSCGEGDWGDNDASPVRIQKKIDGESNDPKPVSRRPACPATLEKFKEAVSLLESKPDIRIRYLGDGGETRDMPGNGRAWDYVDNLPRQVLIAEIRLLSSHFYLFELERSDADKFTTLFICHKDGAKFDEELIQEILNTCSEYRGSWYRLKKKEDGEEEDFSYLYKKKFNHTWHVPGIFTEKIAGYIDILKNNIYPRDAHSPVTTSTTTTQHPSSAVRDVIANTTPSENNIEKQNTLSKLD